VAGEFFYNQPGYEKGLFGDSAVHPLRNPLVFHDASGASVNQLASTKTGLLLADNLYTVNYFSKYYGALFTSVGRFIVTDMTDVLTEAIKSAVVGNIPMGKFGEPTDIAAAVALIAVFGLRARPKQVPSKPAVQNPSSVKQAAPTLPEPPAQEPAANLPVPAESFKQQLSTKPDKARLFAKKKAARAYLPKAKVMLEKGRTGTKDEQVRPVPVNQANSPSNQQALPPPPHKQQRSGSTQEVSPASNSEPTGKPSPRSFGTKSGKGGWNDDLDFGPTKK